MAGNRITTEEEIIDELSLIFGKIWQDEESLILTFKSLPKPFKFISKESTGKELKIQYEVNNKPYIAHFEFNIYGEVIFKTNEEL